MYALKSLSDEGEEYAIEKILDKRVAGGGHDYLVKWEGYHEDNCTWESSENLDCFDLITKFQKAYYVEAILDTRISTVKRN